MIFVDRSRGNAPTALQTQGQVELDQTIRPKASATPPTLTSNDFKRAVYGSFDVRRALWKMQDGKCCFCERELVIKFSTVEHFRPKARATDDVGGSRPGYWWLGYAFENLYLCCQNCNNQKGDYFPLEPGTSALAAEDVPSTSPSPEKPLLIDPGFEDPEPHFDWVFVENKGMLPTGRTPRGEAVLKATKIDADDELTAHRGRHYRKFIAPLIVLFLRAKAAGDAQELARLQGDAHVLAERDSPYVGMTRAALRAAGLL